MKKLRYRFLVALWINASVLVFLFVDSDLLAQHYYIVTYQIHNRTERSLNIQVSSDKRNWKNFTVEPDKVRQFQCDTCKYAKVATNTDSGTKTVEYVMECGMRYSLEYNDGKGCWDFFKARE